MQKLQGWVEQGNTTLSIAQASGVIARKVQGSFPGATITVYLNNPAPAVAIVSIIRVANIVTVTVPSGSNFIAGELVTIAGVTDAAFNGTFTILTSGSTTFTYAQVAGNASSSGGTAQSNLRLANIYSDNSIPPTAKANPFVSAADGTWFAYVPNGHYDVKFSGAGIAAPFTIGDLFAFDPTALFVNVRDYGARGDGVTDDTQAFLNALRSNLAQENVIDTAQTGRLIYVPEGTYRISSPLYLRKGDVLQGVGGTASILKATAGMAAGPILYMGFRSNGTQDSGGLVPIVRGIYFETDAGNANEIVGVQNYIGTSRISGFKIMDCWFTTTIGAVLQGTDGIFSGNVADQCSHLLRLIGDGTRYGVTHSILVEGNSVFAASFAGFWLDGVNDISIVGNYIDFAKQYGIYFSNLSSGGTSYRIKVSDNHFTTSSNASFYTATQTDIDIEWPLEDSSFIGNHFSRSRRACVYSAVGTAINLLFEGNQYQDTNDTAVIIAGSGTGVQFKGESFRNVGNYAIDVTGGAIQISDCYITGAFAVTGLPVNDFDKAGFRFQNSSSSGSGIFNCYTPSTTYAVVTMRSGATGVATRDNRSGWATADVFWFVTPSENGTSSGERISNAGGGIITNPNYTLNVGATGTTFTRIASYSANLTPAATTGNTAADQTFTFTGVQSTDKVASVSPPAAFSGGLFIGTVRIAGANSIAITFVNITGGNLTAPSGVYTVFVYQ